MKTQPPEANALSWLTPGNILYMIFRHKLKILILSTLGAVAALYVFMETPTLYRSEAKLMVRYIAENTSIDLGARDANVLSSDPRGRNIIRSEIQILTSVDLARRVVADIGVDVLLIEPSSRFDPIGRLRSAATYMVSRVIGKQDTRSATVVVSDPDQQEQRAAMRLLSNLHIANPGGGSMLQIYFDASKPELAQKVLGRLAYHYLRRHNEIHRGAGAYDLLAAQTQDLRARLSETEEELQRLKDEGRVVSIDDTKTIIANNMSEAKQALRDAEAELAAALISPDAAAPIGAFGPNAQPAGGSAVLPSAAITIAQKGLEQRIKRLRERELALLATFAESSSPVQDIHRQITELENLVVAPPEVASPRTPSAEEVAKAATGANRQRIERIKSKIILLSRQLDDARREARTLNQLSSRVAELERTRELQESNYLYCRKSLEQARIDQALDQQRTPNISTIQAATYPLSRFRPNLERNVGLAFAFGLFGGLALALLSEKGLDHSLRRPQEVSSNVDAPLLISLPYRRLPGTALPGRRRHQRTRFLEAHNPDKDGSRTWDVHDDLRDYYDTLRDRLVSVLGDGGGVPQVIGVTSCSEGAGVSTIAAGLAVTLARSDDERVLLADADVTRNSGQGIFGIESSSGLVDVVAKGEDNTALVQRNLYMLAGNGAGDGQHHNVVRRFADMIHEFKKSDYRYIILDLPSVDETSLTSRVAGLLDGVLLVIEAEKGHREVIRRGKALLSQVGANVVGTVFNKRKYYVPTSLNRVMQAE